MYQPTTLPCSSCGEVKVEKRQVGVPPLIDPTKLGMHKISGDFRNVLENIKKKTYKSEFDIR